ncbi:hypothetical protein [Brevundimonas nasdae]|nr:hypothetical protein [Brevundimonas nasdae]
MARLILWTPGKIRVIGNESSEFDIGPVHVRFLIRIQTGQLVKMGV